MKLVDDPQLLKRLQAKSGTDPLAQERNNRLTIAAQIDAAKDARKQEIETAAGIVDDTNILTRNLDIPGGIAGGIAGARYGAPLGPKGVILGGIAGGMVGTFAGKYGSEKIKNDPNVDPVDAATHEAIASGVIDTATLGVGKVIRPIANLFKTSPNTLITDGVTPSAPEALTTGTVESLRQTQKLLESEGSTLLTTQTGKASALQKLGTSIGSIGIVSQRMLQKTFDKNAEILANETKRLINGIDSNLAVESDKLGEQIYNIIDLGKKSLNDNYGNGLDAIKNKYGRVKADSRILLNTLDSFVNSKVVDDLQTLDEGALKIINDTRNRIIGEGISSKQSVEKLIAVQKLLSKDITAAGKFNSISPSQNSAELAEFSSKFREALDKTFLNVNSNLASDYQKLNSSFKQARESLVPKLSNRFLAAGDRGNFSQVGKALLGANPSEIKRMMGSIDAGYAQLAKSGKEIDGLVKSPAQAKAMIRQSYLKSLFSDPTGSFDVYKMSTKLAKLESKEEQARLTALLGQEGFASLKRLSNAILESKDAPGANLLSLSIRQKETNLLYGLSNITQAAGAIASGLALPFVLGTPVLALTLATNRTATNKLLGLNKKVERMYAEGKEPTTEFIISNVAKVLDNLSEEEKLHIKAELEDTNKP